MADINTLSNQLDALTAAVKALDSKESGRYVVDSDRYKWVAGALSSISSKVGVDVDEQAVAAALLVGLAPMVGDAIRAALADGIPADPNALADAVVAKLAGKLSA